MHGNRNCWDGRLAQGHQLPRNGVYLFTRVSCPRQFVGLITSLAQRRAVLRLARLLQANVVLSKAMDGSSVTPGLRVRAGRASQVDARRRMGRKTSGAVAAFGS